MAATRLYFLVARQAPLAVVFRRGPSRQVELLNWDLASDTLLAGQWLKGRIYERRCDLSPDGGLLVYFAAKYGTKLRTWTAISKPPWLTALSLWPKGDAWGGGGLFAARNLLQLNHRPKEMELAEEFRLARNRRLRVEPLGEESGWGEDDPIHHLRLLRDGWRWIERGSMGTLRGWTAPILWTIDPPLRYERPVGPRRAALTLQLEIAGRREKNGDSYVNHHRLLRDGELVRDLGRLDWADAGPDGDLLLANDGCLRRLPAADAADWATAEPRLVADLRDHRFAALEAPRDAVHWR
jgi:hypothetical protein